MIAVTIIISRAGRILVWRAPSKVCRDRKIICAKMQKIISLNSMVSKAKKICIRNENNAAPKKRQGKNLDLSCFIIFQRRKKAAQNIPKKAISPKVPLVAAISIS
jgi:hypothetical protein